MTLLLLVVDPAHVIRVSVLHIVTDCDLGHDEMPNVEVTVAARLYRAAFVWTAGLAPLAALLDSTYLTRFQTTSAVPPPEAVATL